MFKRSRPARQFLPQFSPLRVLAGPNFPQKEPQRGVPTSTLSPLEKFLLHIFQVEVIRTFNGIDSGYVIRIMSPCSHLFRSLIIISIYFKPSSMDKRWSIPPTSTHLPIPKPAHLFAYLPMSVLTLCEATSKDVGPRRSIIFFLPSHSFLSMF